MTAILPGGPRATRIAVAILIAVAAAGVYAGTLGNGFVYDDELYLPTNPLVKDGFTAAGAAGAWTSFHAYNWHPLTWYSHMLDVQLFGLSPAGHHAVNALLHALNAAILFLLLAGLTGAPGRSAFAAGLFALHPLHVESVAWVAERKDLLSVLFGLLAVAAYGGYVRRPSAGRYLGVLALFAAALLAKPMLVTLPALLLLLDWWPLGRIAGPRGPAPWSPAWASPIPWRRALAEKAPLLLLSVASSAITLAAQRGAMIPLDVVPFPDRIANAFVSVVRYVAKAVVPTGLAAFYPYDTGILGGLAALGAIAVVAAVTALALRVARVAPHAPVGWLWFLTGLLPVIGLVQVGSQAMADRYTYLPLVGVFVAASWSFADLGERLRVPKAAMAAAAGACLALLAALTMIQVRTWKDDVTLFRHAIAVTRRNHVAHYNLGVALMKSGDIRGALAEYGRALEAKPDYVLAMVNQGALLSQVGRQGEAEALYRRAIAADPRHAEAHHNLAVLLAARGAGAEAEQAYRTALALTPTYTLARRNYGLLLAGAGRTVEALAQFGEAVLLAPKSAVDRVNLAAALANLGRFREAEAEYRLALALDPTDDTVKRDLDRVTALAAKPPAVRE